MMKKCVGILLVAIAFCVEKTICDAQIDPCLACPTICSLKTKYANTCDSCLFGLNWAVSW